VIAKKGNKEIIDFFKNKGFTEREERRFDDKAKAEYVVIVLKKELID